MTGESKTESRFLLSVLRDGVEMECVFDGIPAALPEMCSYKDKIIEMNGSVMKRAEYIMTWSPWK